MQQDDPKGFIGWKGEQDLYAEAVEVISWDPKSVVAALLTLAL
jgi:hypothetical protein